jgi:P-type Ca2+ transporter type 2C
MAEILWHTLSVSEAVSSLDSDIKKGISQEEFYSRQERYGKNVLSDKKSLSKLRIFWDQLKSPLIYILIIAGIISLVFREWADAVVIFGAVLLNTAVGFFQENKASEALAALKKIVKIRADVIRGGHEMEVDSEDLVPGDIIVLTSGNKVPADARIIESHNLKINEAPLTGEWEPAVKKENKLPEETPVADRDNMAYMGTAVVDGKGRAVVTSIGSGTQVGKVAFLVRETEEEKTPLQKKLAGFSKLIGIVVVFMAAGILVGGLLKGMEFLEMFMTSVAIAVAAIPEGLPVAMTVILALGMQRILKEKGLVRRLAAAEILGSTSIIATDKTLTLTEGTMTVAKTVTPGIKIEAENNNTWGDVFKRNYNADQALLVKAAAVCSEAFVENPGELYPLWRIRGGPTDRAVLLGGAEVGIKKHELEEVYHKDDEIPFNSENKYIAALISANPKNEVTRKTRASLIRDPILDKTDHILFVSGAPEKIIRISSRILKDEKEEKINKKKSLELTEDLEDLTGQGLRVVGIGYRKMEGKKYKNLEKEIKDLVFVGFIGLRDPLRPKAKEAIGLCKKAGMRPIMLTGDHLLTAKAVGKELGLRTGSKNIINGTELDKMSDEEFQKRVGDFDIFARVEPKHKMRIIEAWQSRNKVVAMTGDGINDAPALKKADIGVALGSGTDVAKEVSDLILLTDDFNIIVSAIEEGRAIIDNIRKVITYLLSGSLTETILIGVSLLLGWPLPLVAVQILWINLIEDGLPGVALAFEAKEDDVLERKPEQHTARLLTTEMKAIIFVISIITDFLLLGLLWWLMSSGREFDHVRSIIFAGLAIDSLFYIFSCKNLRKNIWQYNPFSNKFLVISWTIAVLALIAAFYVPILNVLLKTVPLYFDEWMIVLGLGIVNLALIEAAKYYFIARHQTD